MAKEIAATSKGLAGYAESAASTASGWTNFFTGGDRPKDASGVREYVRKKIVTALCDPAIAHGISQKPDASARQQALAGVQSFRQAFAGATAPAFTAADLACPGQ
jgi:hypothetical protein